MPPSDTAMTDVTTLKTWLKDTGSGSDDQLTALIQRVSGFIRGRTNRTTFFNAASTDVLSGNGRDRLILRTRPVTEITSVTVDGVAIPAATGATDSGYLFDEYGLWLRGYLFTRGIRNITVVYKGGFATASAEAEMAAQACLMIAAAWWRRREHIDMVAKELGQPSGIMHQFSQRDIPAEAQTIINALTTHVHA